MSLQKLKRGGGSDDEEPPAKKRRIAMHTLCLQHFADVIPTFKEKVEELLDKFPGYDPREGEQTIPALYKKEMEKLFDDISTYLTTQYAAELLNDKHSLYREKRDEYFTYQPGPFQQYTKISITNWVRNKVSESEQQNRMTFMPFKDEIVWCGAYVQALTQAFQICERCKTEEEKRIAATKAAEAAAKAAEAAAKAEANKKREKERAKNKKKIKKMEETFLDDFTQSLNVRYFPEQAKWLPDFDMALLQKFKEAKEKFIDEDEEVKDLFSSDQTILDRVREVTQHAVKALLAPQGGILTLTDMAAGGVSQVFDLRGTDGALMAWGSGTSHDRNVKLVLQCSLDEKIENFVDFVDTTYSLPISTPQTYATLNERLPVPFVRFVVRGGALSQINVKVSFK
jgi:hypothetical protein